MDKNILQLTSNKVRPKNLNTCCHNMKKWSYYVYAKISRNTWDLKSLDWDEREWSRNKHKKIWGNQNRFICLIFKAEEVSQLVAYETKMPALWHWRNTTKLSKSFGNICPGSYLDRCDILSDNSKYKWIYKNINRFCTLLSPSVPLCWCIHESSNRNRMGQK